MPKQSDAFRATRDPLVRPMLEALMLRAIRRGVIASADQPGALHAAIAAHMAEESAAPRHRTVTEDATAATAADQADNATRTTASATVVIFPPATPAAPATGWPMARIDFGYRSTVVEWPAHLAANLERVYLVQDIAARRDGTHDIDTGILKKVYTVFERPTNLPKQVVLHEASAADLLVRSRWDQLAVAAEYKVRQELLNGRDPDWDRVELLGCKWQYDGHKLVVHFNYHGASEFRFQELVSKLSSTFLPDFVRIHMHQNNWRRRGVTEGR